jgi:putative FmdB family regulatory protein
MPTYDYTCDACSHSWEEFQPMSAAVTRKCPECKKLKARRLIGSGAGLIFKGSGFYVTDYKKSGSGEPKPIPSGSASGGSDSKSGGDSGSKSDSKSSDSAAAKSDSAPASTSSDSPKSSSHKDSGSASQKDSKKSTGSKPAPTAA